MQEKYSAKETMKSQQELKFKNQEEEISRLRTRLESQTKRFDEVISGLCERNHKHEETIKTQRERLEAVEADLAGLEEQAKYWLEAAQKINQQFISKSA